MYFLSTRGALVGALGCSLVLLGSAGCVAPEGVVGMSSGGSPARSVTAVAGGRLAAVLQEDVDAIVAAGAVGAVAEVIDEHTSVRARAGAAALGSADPVPFDGHFRMGSATKPFIAVVVLQLAGEGRLSLEDPVSKWVPDLVQGNGNDGSRITIRQLLQHTSGLFDYLYDRRFISTIFSPEAFEENRLREWTPEELVGMAVSHPPTSEPGAAWRYTNTGYVLAGMVIEAVTGEPWAVQLRKRIIEPLGLTRTYAPGSHAVLASPFSRGYELYGTDGGYFDVTEKNMTMAGASGALVTSTADLSRFFVALMRGELLESTQLREMLKTVPVREGAAYGLGLRYEELPCRPREGYWSHDGTALGYETLTGVLADGSRSVVASVTTTDALYGGTRFDEKAERSMDALVRHALCSAR